MTAPPPGKTPRIEPRKVPRTTAFHESLKSFFLGQRPRILDDNTRRSWPFSKFKMISEMPNKPTAMGTNPNPSANSGTQKVKRDTPVLTSVPMRPKNSPTRIIATALITEPWASTTAEMRPKTMSEKYSGDENLWEKEAREGPKIAMNNVPTHPAKKEPRAAMERATPARPCWAILWPSMHV